MCRRRAMRPKRKTPSQPSNQTINCPLKHTEPPANSLHKQVAGQLRDNNLSKEIRQVVKRSVGHHCLRYLRLCFTEFVKQLGMKLVIHLRAGERA